MPSGIIKRSLPPSQLRFRLNAIFALACILVFSAVAQAQACGISLNTFYITDANGKPIKDVTIEFLNEKFRIDEHFQLYTQTYWDDKLKAYVSKHGLCGEHFRVGIRIIANGFESVNRKFDLPFNERTFAVSLARVGKKQKTKFEQVVNVGNTYSN